MFAVSGAAERRNREEEGLGRPRHPLLACNGKGARSVAEGGPGKEHESADENCFKGTGNVLEVVHHGKNVAEQDIAIWFPGYGQDNNGSENLDECFKAVVDRPIFNAMLTNS